MLNRLRHAMTDDSGKIGNNGPVEIDETFIGGKIKNMYRFKVPQDTKYRGGSKTIVLGMLECGGKVRAGIIDNRKGKTLQPIIREQLEPGTEVFTDMHLGYWGLDAGYAHQMVDHAVEYVRGHVHTNGIENFCSLLKRGLTAPTSQWNRFTYSHMSQSKYFATTTAKT